MHIAILALGSRGDVQPYVALGQGLQQAGHTVHLLTHPAFAPLVRAYGLAFWPVHGDVQAVADSPEVRDLLEKGKFVALSRITAQAAQEMAPQWAQDGLAASSGVDLFIAGIGGLFLGLALAEKLQRPFLPAFVVPFTPTAAFPGVLQPLPRLGGPLNRLTHHLTRQMMWQGSRAADNRTRDVLGLPPAPLTGPYRAPRMANAPTLYGFSPSVIARPADWPARAHVTGYWFLDAAPDWQPPAALTAFLEAGPPPISIGFGSMGSRQPEETADLILRALAQTGQRAILLSGWGGLRTADLPDTVFMADAIPHAWLFPRVAAVVHHGGAGTTAAGLAAGVPSIVVPFFADQFFWGQRVAALGAGPAPLPRKQLTADRLAAAIRTALADPAMRRRAADLGAAIRAENGRARAAAVVADMFLERKARQEDAKHAKI